MPILDFLDQASLSGDASVHNPNDTITAAMRTWAIMSWPSEEKRRNEFLATVGALAVGHVKDLQNPIQGVADVGTFNALRHDIASIINEQWMQPFGGETTVAKAPGWDQIKNEIGKRAEKLWQPTAWIVLLMMIMEQNHKAQLRRGPSVAKAVELIEAMKMGTGPHNRKDLMNAWGQMKPVANLCMAFLVLHIEARQLNPKATVGFTTDLYFARFDKFLAYARIGQNFLLTYKSHSQGEPLTKRSELWTVPDELVLPSIQLNLDPLPASHLNVLKDYRAPKKL